MMQEPLHQLQSTAAANSFTQPVPNHKQADSAPAGKALALKVLPTSRCHTLKKLVSLASVRLPHTTMCGPKWTC